MADLYSREQIIKNLEQLLDGNELIMSRLKMVNSKNSTGGTRLELECHKCGVRINYKGEAILDAN